MTLTTSAIRRVAHPSARVWRRVGLFVGKFNNRAAAPHSAHLGLIGDVIGTAPVREPEISRAADFSLAIADKSPLTPLS